MKNEAKYYYELADVLFYKRIGKNVWVTCKKEAWLKNPPIVLKLGLKQWNNILLVIIQNLSLWLN